MTGRAETRRIQASFIPAPLLTAALPFQGGLGLVCGWVGSGTRLFALADSASFPNQAPTAEQVGLYVQPIVAVEITGGIAAGKENAAHTVSREMVL